MQFSLFHPSISFYIEASHLIRSANQMTRYETQHWAEMRYYTNNIYLFLLNIGHYSLVNIVSRIIMVNNIQ